MEQDQIESLEEELDELRDMRKATMERLKQVGATLSLEGLVSLGSRGQPRAHPLVEVERILRQEVERYRDRGKKIEGELADLRGRAHTREKVERINAALRDASAPPA